MTLSRKHIAYALLTAVLILAALLLALPFIINSDALQARLQSSIQRQAGKQIEYQQAELSFLPRLAITLKQVSIDIPGRAQGRAASFRLYPELWPLLSGQVLPERIVLVSPDMTLTLTEEKPKQEHQATSGSLEELKNYLEHGLKPLAKLAPDMTLLIENGTLSLNQEGNESSVIKGITLKLALQGVASRAPQVKLQSTISSLSFQHNGRETRFEGLTLDAGLHAGSDTLSLTLDELTLAKPALQVSGSMQGQATAPAFTLDLKGKDIDVDATREALLAMAGNTSPVKEIFDYLRGGRIPRISFHSQAETVSGLGNLKDISIKGELQAGAVSAPLIKLDLTEVNGEVVISQGILQATNMSTRLEGSSGHDGTLKVGLAEDSDLFQLELMLSADLAQAQNLLKRVVDNPAFNQELLKITNLRGNSSGKLLLGDQLNNLRARVEVTDLNLSANYQGLPFPLKVNSGQLVFTEGQASLQGLSGALGKSDFEGLSGEINWEKGLSLDMHSGPFRLVLDEFYPWLASLQAAEKSLQDIQQLTGRLDLSAWSFKGHIDRPEEWQFATAGKVRDVSLVTPKFPDKLNLSQGTFKIDADQWTLQEIKARSLDADLVLSVTLAGLPRAPDSVELLVNGQLGKDAAAWLQKAIEAPKNYTLRTPVTISEANVIWKQDRSTSVTGKLSIADGPDLVLDVTQRPGQLSVNQLKIKDQHSDVEMAFKTQADERSLDFKGTLQHQTLAALFVEQPFGKGQIRGDFGVKFSARQKSPASARGQLTGEELTIPLAPEEVLTLEYLSLVADGAKVKAEANKLSWNDFVWDPVKATINFGPDKIDINITESEMCGIASSGVVTIAGQDLALDLSLQGKTLDLATCYSCLTEGRVKMTGALDFSTRVSAQGQARELLNNLRGPLEMSFSNGTIEQSKLLTRTLEVLNVTEIVKGKLPNLASSGFAYSNISIEGDFHGDSLVVNKLIMEGETLDLLGQGVIDFGQETIDVELLAAPLKTVDTVVKHIPGINYLLAGSLVTIPVSIKGNQNNPKVSILSPSSVGSSLMNLGSRIMKSPLKLIETMTPSSSKNKNENQSLPKSP